MEPRRVVFSDFDGTITAEETLLSTFLKFAPGKFNRLAPEIMEGRMTIREGVRAVLGSIPSRRYPEILDYLKSKPLRPGLVELFDFLDLAGTPFVVISGGLRGMVETSLGPLLERVESVYSADVSTEGEYLRVVSDYESDSELVAKARIMDFHPADESVVIGDGATDVSMALKADLVFARDVLASYLKDNNISYQPFKDFFDVRDILAERWGIDPDLFF